MLRVLVLYLFCYTFSLCNIITLSLKERCVIWMWPCECLMVEQCCSCRSQQQHPLKIAALHSDLIRHSCSLCSEHHSLHIRLKCLVRLGNGYFVFSVCPSFNNWITSVTLSLNMISAFLIWSLLCDTRQDLRHIFVELWWWN